MQVKQTLRRIVANRSAVAKSVAPVVLLLAAGAASADTGTVALDTVLDGLMASLAAGVGTIFTKIAPIMVLTFGVAYAWRWVKRV